MTTAAIMLVAVNALLALLGAILLRKSWMRLTALAFACFEFTALIVMVSVINGWRP